MSDHKHHHNEKRHSKEADASEGDEHAATKEKSARRRSLEAIQSLFKKRASTELPNRKNIEVKEDEALALHKAVWLDDIAKVEKILEKHPKSVNQVDPHGNTPLHIAAHFANINMVELLILKGADPEVLSKPGWRAIDEAIASGSLEVAKSLMMAGYANYRSEMERKAKIWHSKLKNMPDFYLELNWEFQLLGNWVPFVSSFIPNDVYRIWKRGSSLRLDYSLIGFKNFKITRGNVSFVFTGEDHEQPGHLFVLNHDQETRQDFCEPPGPNFSQQIDDALAYLFAHDLCSHLPLAKRNGNGLQFEVRKGWFSSAPLEEDIKGMKAVSFNTKGMKFKSVIRSDPIVKQTRIPRTPHSLEVVESNRDAYDRYFGKTGETDSDTDDDMEHTVDGLDTSSLASWKNGLVWPNEKITRKVRKFEGKVWLSNDFPLSVEQFLDIVEIYSPTNQQLKRVQEFIQSNLPSGFPVKIQIPIFYLITASMEIGNFRKEVPSVELFDIPQHYNHIAEAYIGHETREMFKVVESKQNKS
eukprot:TRINITY_DN6394_c0_g1_i1.p1 TRINITY_DN6394_c0_g1~~TRINITY_DN6394_c0_g1_i1.p1  ORF type:complete len:527 (+),score=105.41 TRINITY_DN6394_c0_g1_i1:158-1738(+)